MNIYERSVCNTSISSLGGSFLLAARTPKSFASRLLFILASLLLVFSQAQTTKYIIVGHASGLAREVGDPQR
jgi:hypothetical protein